LDNLIATLCKRQFVANDAQPVVAADSQQAPLAGCPLNSNVRRLNEERVMTDDLLKLAVGFMLTTLCGGLLGFAFQRRHARYQWLRSRWEKELSEAQAVFEEVSRILDRRLYRTRRLLWSLDRGQDLIEDRLSDYRAVVFEWNDNVNRILALLAIHFSAELRDTIDNEIGAEYVAIGRALEQTIRGTSEANAEELEQRLDRLATSVYDFNLHILKEIKARRNALKEDT
jgi:glucose-6-phosphate-specific signal transduction histidine kinase